MCAFAGVAARGDTRLSACVFPKFYWLAPGNGRTFTFTYLHAGGVRSSTITFNVSGPTATGPLVGQGPERAFFEATVKPPPAGTTPNQIVNVWPNAEDEGRAWLRFGRDGIDPGIYFDVTAEGPGGSGIYAGYQFIQLITLSAWKHRSTYESNGGLRVGLDNGWYLYARTPSNRNRALDFPGAGLYFTNTADPIAESAVKFGATMYLMWDPALPNGCKPADKAGGNPATESDCTESIPVPLGKINWGFSASAINTRGPALPGVSNQTSWIMENCGGPNPRTYSKTTDHPTWYQ